MAQLELKPKSSTSKLLEINVFVLLFAVLAISVILTYVIPAGEYARVDVNGRSVVDAQSFQFTESSPVKPLGLVNSVHTGMEEASGIIFFVLIIGGTFGILTATGAIEALIVTLSKKLQNQEKWLIPIMMFFFAMGGSLMGMAEETIPYIAIMIPLAIALGFDAITGAAIVLVGASVGFTSAVMNPFTIGVAQGLAELPTFSGAAYRIGIFVVMYIASVAFVYRYAMKVKRDRGYGFFGNFEGKNATEMFSGDAVLTTRHKVILSFFALNFCVLAYGVIKYGWYITEIAGLFLLLGIIIGIAGKLPANTVVDSFIKGAAGVLAGALVIGVARAIVVVLNDGHILDTILYYAAALINEIPPALTAFGMLVLQTIISFIVPSGSGMAALTMPIMTPLADLVGVTRQTAVLAYQFGDGISNIFVPTSGYFMAGLAIAGIPWVRWMKWILPLLAIHYAIATAAVIIAQLIGYGPF
ncbi:YfcC family protein [Brevibacillus composti]|uniref:Putative basic amino acid antiporter YfcC n=1 Tax=Brevibacillus composti TaxID=2796470 RepID=A0A7T5JPP4_9BACL|nr:AbgT family transporter [Brevibacillus composti]QQE75392.1 putative basic amino acid antiporter YfcC [Brevibacillus composti]QUO42418.1 YfcC family protein [Brevibacillus composti]